MKILYIANSRIPTEKAHGLQIMKTIEALLEKGEGVSLLLPRRKNPIKVDARSFYHLRKIPKYIWVPNFFKFFEKRIERVYFPLQRFSFAVCAFVLGIFSKADVIYSREITISFLLSVFGKNVVYEDHEPKKSLRGLYAFFIRRIKRKILVAPNLTTLYEKAGVSPDSYIVVPNGVDLKDFEEASPNKDFFKDLPPKKNILYVGSFYEWKGIYTLIGASSSLDANVVCVGGTDSTIAAVQKYVEENGLKNVFLKKFISHNEVIPVLKAADVLVLPNTSKEERSNLYTTPLKLFEYMASGTPIVASDIPSFKRFVRNKENVLLVQPDASVVLAESINRLLIDKELSAKISLQALRDIQEYSWNKRVQDILRFICG